MADVRGAPGESSAGRGTHVTVPVLFSFLCETWESWRWVSQPWPWSFSQGFMVLGIALARERRRWSVPGGWFGATHVVFLRRGGIQAILWTEKSEFGDDPHGGVLSGAERRTDGNLRRRDAWGCRGAPELPDTSNRRIFEAVVIMRERPAPSRKWRTLRARGLPVPCCGAGPAWTSFRVHCVRCALPRRLSYRVPARRAVVSR